MVGGQNGPSVTPQKTSIFHRKMLRLLEIFLVKNSSPFFSKLVRVRGPNHHIFLIGTIKPCNICYWHFLLRSFLSEIFDDPFHQTKKGEANKTVLTQQRVANQGQVFKIPIPYFHCSSTKQGFDSWICFVSFCEVVRAKL